MKSFFRVGLLSILTVLISNASISAQSEMINYEDINNTFVEQFGGGRLNRYIVSNLNIEDRGNRIVQERGGRLRATLEVFHDCPECGGQSIRSLWVLQVRKKLKAVFGTVGNPALGGKQ